MNWTYGVTTVPQRLPTLLPRTLEALRNAGFPSPRVFLDGSEGVFLEALEGCEVSQRKDPLRAYGAWVLAAWELYLRDPKADRYAIFQDDITCCRNLRQYLDRCPFPERGYWNLYTVPANVVPNTRGWVPSPRQDGKGAIGLVFNNEGLRLLLANQYMVDRVHDEVRGHKSIDGGVVTAMSNLGWKEYVHQPSLVQHIGTESVIGNSFKKVADTFPGDSFDALELLSTACC